MTTIMVPKINMRKKLLEKTFLLKEISLKRVVVILCSQPDISILCARDFWEDGIEDTVKEKLPKLQLPKVITQQMKYLIESIGSEKRKWKWCHREYFKYLQGSIYADILEHLYWTHFGTIDYQKTAENLICMEKLDIVERYRLACLYCLEDAIPVLWRRLPADKKRYFYDEVASHIQSPQLEFCWPYIIKGEEIKLDSLLERLNRSPASFNIYAFHYSVREGNKSATEHFLKRLTHVERESSLIKAVKDVLEERELEILPPIGHFPVEKISENFFHLLSLLTSEQQMEIFNKNIGNVLYCLLVWPWRCIFLDMATLLWPFVTIKDYYSVLEEISEIVVYKYDSQKLFHDFFLLGSNDFKKYFVHHESQHSSCLNRVFIRVSEIEIAEFIKIFFRNIDPEDRKIFVSSEIIFSKFFSIISRDEFHIVESCLQEATLSKEDKEEVMQAFLRFLGWRKVKKIDLTGSSWERFFQFFNESKEEVLSTKANKENL